MPRAFLVAEWPLDIREVTGVRGCLALSFFIWRPNSLWYLDTLLFFFGSSAANVAPSDSRSDPINRRSASYSSSVKVTFPMLSATEYAGYCNSGCNS